MRMRELAIVRGSGRAALVPAVAVLLGASVVASPQSETLRREGYQAAYNLDHERAMDLFRQAIDADPNDAAAYRGAASVSWLRVLFLRGTVLVDDYIGHLKSTGDVPMPAPPASLDTAFHRDIDRAIALAEREVDRHYNDASSHYDLGAGLGLYASYAGTVEGRVFTAMRMARRAFNESELALDLDSRKAEAGLVVGTYRYLVSTLPMPVRVMAYIVGFGGGRDEGLRLIERAAASASDIQTEARFALVLLYNRERRYADAVTVIRSLERSCPQNRLLLLEEASTLLRGNQPQEAERVLDEAMSRLAQDPRPRMPGEEVRWHYKRGMARLQLGKLNEAEDDLERALGTKDSHGWVTARIHVELGKLADLRGDRARAQREYRNALAITRTAGDAEAESQATRLLAQAYRQ